MQIIPICIYLLAALTYSCGALLSYSDSIRNSYRIYLYGLITSNVGALLWLFLVKYLNNNQSIYVAGIIWDVIMVSTFLLVPLMFYNIPLTRQIICGLTLIVVGIIIIKI